MALSRIESVSPETARRVDVTSSEKRHSAVVVACARAASDTDLAGEDVNRALALIRESGVHDLLLRHRIETLAQEFDDEYLRLVETEDPAREIEAMKRFRMARATSALAWALSSDEGVLHEAIYEAIHAVRDQKELIALVNAALT